MEVKEQIENFLEKRPKTVYAFGYGSGVFRQSGYTEKDKPQIDLILAVKDIRAWHLENMKKNPNDYSFTGKLFYSHSSINRIKGYNGITYQSNIEEDGQLFKYGVIEVEDLERQLISWNRFYLAGRFQKTVLTIQSTKEFDAIMKQNREGALLTALYFLEDGSTLTELYEKIVSLSFMGDTRMRFFENPNKIKNIVSKAKEEFDAIYGVENELFDILEDETIKINRKNVEKKFLPACLAASLMDVKKEGREAMKKEIEAYLTKRNKIESKKQTMHGLSTNGIVRSSNYVLQKVKKRIYKK